MELFRSERMRCVRVIVPSEAARATLDALGELASAQFVDLNQSSSSFARAFAPQIRRAEELLRRLRYFASEGRKARAWTRWTATAARRDAGGGTRNASRTNDVDALDHASEEFESELRSSLRNFERLTRTHSELVELQLVLEKAGRIFDESRATSGARASEDAFDSNRAYDDVEGRQTDATETLLPRGRGENGDGRSTGRTGSYLEMAELGSERRASDGRENGTSSENSQGNKAVRLGFITGVMLTHKVIAFERILFRATRGNMFLKQSPIPGFVVDPTTGEKCEKTVIVVFFAGERAREKILKICEAFNVNRYPFPEDYTRQRQMYAECTARLIELQSTLDASTAHRDDILRKIGENLYDWFEIVLREKAIYHAMNMCSVDVTRKVLVAQAWVPTYATTQVQEALLAANAAANASVGTIFQQIESKDMPPTHFQTTKVTAVFQGIVEAYGVASYREVNPAVATIVTFPFLFAVMFGDFGHGFLLLLVALYLVANEKKMGARKLNEIVQMAFDGRYAILFMSIFSIYTGLLYNECFSVPMNWFGNSNYVCDPKDPTAATTCDSKYVTGLVNNGRGAYAFGIDPIWHGSRSELPFLNSVKMKMSILMGVTQMMLGIFMSLLNHIYRGDRLSLFFEFIPQVLFLGALFGYLSLLIIIKWCTPGSTADLYHVMIYMFLAPGNVDCAGDGANGGPGCPENVLFPGQAAFQNFLLMVAFIAVPVMLIPKPYFLKKRHEAALGGVRRATSGYSRLDSSDENEFLQASDAEQSDAIPGSGHGHDHEFDFTEIVVHQAIHTIEFVLGAVSNTASYLRLWALSLAHAQLSAVFWDRVFMGAVASGNVFAIVIGFSVWACATIGVLMLMESLSAFLHALRLHWVEYMNKFYGGLGTKFTPFSFAGLVAEEFAEKGDAVD